MKQLYALILAFASFVTASAQNFELLKRDVFVYGPSADIEIVGHSQVKNISANTSFTWKRLVISGPAEWRSGICDKVSCWSETTGRNTVTINAGDSGLLDLHLYPYGKGGSGVIALAVWAGSDSANADTVFYHINSWYTAVNNVKKEEKLLIYPNPARTSINLNYESDQTVKVEIYDVLGKVLKTTTHSGKTSNINIEDLPSGLYIVRIYDNGTTYSRTFKKVP